MQINIIDLPLEILFDITINYLSYFDIIRLCKICTYFNISLYKNEYFWQSFYLQTISSISLSGVSAIQLNDKSTINFNNIEDYSIKCKNIFRFNEN